MLLQLLKHSLPTTKDAKMNLTFFTLQYLQFLLNI